MIEARRWARESLEAVQRCKGGSRWASGQGRGKGQAARGGVKIFLRCGENVIRTGDYVSRIQKFHFAR